MKKKLGHKAVGKTFKEAFSKEILESILRGLTEDSIKHMEESKIYWAVEVYHNDSFYVYNFSFGIYVFYRVDNNEPFFAINVYEGNYFITPKTLIGAGVIFIIVGHENLVMLEVNSNDYTVKEESEYIH